MTDRRLTIRIGFAGFATGSSFPLIAAPRFLAYGLDLVLAACRAGVDGAFPAPNARTIETLEAWLQTIATGHEALALGGARPGRLALNPDTHSSYDRLGSELELVDRYRPPLVITALGSPEPVTARVHAYGDFVIADVNKVEFARKAARTGVDGLDPDASTRPIHNPS